MSLERQNLESDSRWWGEHLHRYKEAIKLIKPADIILDIACGTGFGTAALANATSGKVVGGDIDKQAIEECNANWNRDNIEFQVMDGTALTFPDKYFDSIVSFETIEHTTCYRDMLKEFKRVLKPGGMLILSTPNVLITSPNGKIKNPYHTQEFHYDELKDILGEQFDNVSLSGQLNTRYDKLTFKKTIGRLFEFLFLGFGVSKLPYSFRNTIMKRFFGYPLYPKETDFVLEFDRSAINKKCPVLFAVCKK